MLYSKWNIKRKKTFRRRHSLLISSSLVSTYTNLGWIHAIVILNIWLFDQSFRDFYSWKSFLWLQTKFWTLPIIKCWHWIFEYFERTTAPIIKYSFPLLSEFVQGWRSSWVIYCRLMWLNLVSITRQMPRPRHKNKAIIRLSSHPSR